MATGKAKRSKSPGYDKRYNEGLMKRFLHREQKQRFGRTGKEAKGSRVKLVFRPKRLRNRNDIFQTRFAQVHNQDVRTLAVLHQRREPEKFKKEVKDHVFRETASHDDMLRKGHEDFLVDVVHPDNQHLKYRAANASVTPLYSKYEKPLPPSEILKRELDPNLKGLKRSMVVPDKQQRKIDALELAITHHRTKYEDPKEPDFRAPNRPEGQLKNFDIPAVVPDNQYKRREGLDLVHTHHRTRYNPPVEFDFRGDASTVRVSPVKELTPKSELQKEKEDLIATMKIASFQRGKSVPAFVGVGSSVTTRNSGSGSASPFSPKSLSRRMSPSIRSRPMTSPLRTFSSSKQPSYLSSTALRQITRNLSPTYQAISASRRCSPNKRSNMASPKNRFAATPKRFAATPNRFAAPTEPSSPQKVFTWHKSTSSSPKDKMKSPGGITPKRRNNRGRPFSAAASVASEHSNADFSEEACYRMIPKFLMMEEFEDYGWESASSTSDKATTTPPYQKPSAGHPAAYAQKFVRASSPMEKRNAEEMSSALRRLTLSRSRPPTVDTKEPKPWDLQYQSRAMQEFSSNIKSEVYAASVLRSPKASNQKITGQL
mmetsp:Transcript_14043/g.22393  ORF Transcript_14043/g.22393 Transcript_14043/m.22393 type:complete len:599 (-) Transcript_14043:53-1849(-)